jgi:uncharacterized protein (DUF58 family)
MTPVPSRRLVRWAVGGALAAFGVLLFPGAWPALVAFDVLLAAVALLDLLVTPDARALEITRQAPDRMSVLSEQAVALRVRNRFGGPLRVRLRDTPPEALGAAPELGGTVPARGEARWEYRVTPRSRGRFAWGDTYVRFRSLAGFWEKTARIAAPGEVRVYPNLVQLQRYHLLARANRLESLGIRKVRLRGGAWEFESLRDYVPGDDTRLIDWKATARRRKPIVRNREAERNQTVLILVDSGRLMNALVDGVAKLDHAVNSALMLAHVALARGDKVGLCAFSHRVHAWVPPRGRLGQNRLLGDALYDLRGDFTETDHGRCLRLVRARYPKRALLVLLTDFVDAPTSADLVTHLRVAGRRHLVLFVALKDPFLDEAAHGPAEVPLDGFRKAAAVDLLHDRREVLERIRQQGAFVVDVDPAGVTPPVINRYLEITHRGLL